MQMGQDYFAYTLKKDHICIFLFPSPQKAKRNPFLRKWWSKSYGSNKVIVTSTTVVLRGVVQKKLTFLADFFLLQSMANMEIIGKFFNKNSKCKEAGHFWWTPVKWRWNIMKNYEICLYCILWWYFFSNITK